MVSGSLIYYNSNKEILDIVVFDVSDPETEMINWVNLIANSFWILGCALALATLSYASWQASFENKKMRMVLSSPACKISLYTAGALFSIGLAATSDQTWEVIFWIVLVILFAVQIGVSIRQKKKTMDISNAE